MALPPPQTDNPNLGEQRNYTLLLLASLSIRTSWNNSCAIYGLRDCGRVLRPDIRKIKEAMASLGRERPRPIRPRDRVVLAQLPFPAFQPPARGRQRLGSHFLALTNVSFDGEPSRPALRVQAPGGGRATDSALSHGTGGCSQQPSKEPTRGHPTHDSRSYISLPSITLPPASSPLCQRSGAPMTSGDRRQEVGGVGPALGEGPKGRLCSREVCREATLVGKDCWCRGARALVTAVVWAA